MKRILITGGAGFIGSNLALKLIEKGYEITVLDKLSKQIHGDNPEESVLYKSIKNKVKFIKGDVRKSGDWEIALHDVDCVVHLAAETGTGQSMYEIKKYVDVNIGGTALLLDYLTNQNHHVNKIIVSSSRAIYGEGKYKCPTHGVVYPDSREELQMNKGDFNCKCPICETTLKPLATDEDSKIHPTSIYGITKYDQEQMVLTVGKALGIPSVAFRYQNVYGPGQSLSNPYTGILSIFSTIIKNKNKINIFEDGFESRDFVYIDDVVNATIMGIESQKNEFEVYNVGSGEITTVIEVVEMLSKAFNLKVNYEITGNYRLGDIRTNYAALSKIKKELGFTPTISFEYGIKQFVSWVNAQGIKEDKFLSSIQEMKSKGLYK